MTGLVLAPLAGWCCLLKLLTSLTHQNQLFASPSVRFLFAWPAGHFIWASHQLWVTTGKTSLSLKIFGMLRVGISRGCKKKKWWEVGRGKITCKQSSWFLAPAQHEHVIFCSSLLCLYMRAPGLLLAGLGRSAGSVLAQGCKHYVGPPSRLCSKTSQVACCVTVWPDKDL